MCLLCASHDSQGPTSGGTSFVVAGLNFGGSPQIFFDNTPLTCTPLGAPTVQSLTCTSPAREGLGHFISVSAGNQTINATIFWNYDSPVINSISPSVGPTPGVSSLLVGGVSLGTGFGSYSSYLRQCLTYSGADTTNPATTRTGWTVNAPYLEATAPTVANMQVTPPVGSLFGGVNYDILMTWPNAGPSKSSVVQVTVQKLGGSVTYFVNQQQSGSLPVSILPDGQEIQLNPSQFGNVMVRVDGPAFGGYGVDTIYICRRMATANPSAASVYNSVNIDLPLGAGAGTGGEFVLKVLSGGKTQSSSYSTKFDPAYFSFQAPTITSVVGCIDSGVQTSVCDPAGGQRIQIRGTNFGVDALLIRVTITSRLGVYTCGSVSVSISHTAINCTLPAIAEAGLNLPVTVSVAGQVVVASYVSYRVPTINSNSLDPNCLGSTVTSLQLTTCVGGQLICLTGTNFGNVSSSVSVTYGTVGQPNVFTCQMDVSRFVIGTGLGCRLAEGVGSNLAFTVTVGTAISVQSSDLVSYPTPILVNSTIRGALLPVSSGRSAYTPFGKSTQGDFVVFDAKFLPFSVSLWSLVSVTFGAYGADVSTYKPCSQLQIYSNATVIGSGSQFAYAPNAVSGIDHHAIRCHTAPGSGKDLVFRVVALNAVAIPSNDTYTYPLGAPAVTRISGCSSDTDLGAVGCSTAGGYPITVYGNNLCSRTDTDCALTVFVARNRCTNLRFSEDGFSITCIAPAGIGRSLPVTAVIGNSFSQPVSGVTLSYGGPILWNVTGCRAPSVSSVSGGVSRRGLEQCVLGGVITLNGANFGASGGDFRIDNQRCVNLVHDANTPHSKITCTLPATRTVGRPLNDLPVLFIDFIGQSAGQSGTTISYVACPLGTTPVSGVCTACSGGTYNAVTNGPCVSCGAGSYAASGSSACRLCAPGTFASSAALSGACSTCGAGQYSSKFGSVSCETCSPGTVPNSVQSACVACPAGTFGGGASGLCTPCPAESSSKNGSALCTPCDAGMTAVSGGVCTPCLPGTRGPTAGGGCTSCLPGRYSSEYGSVVCALCDLGTYTNETGVSACKPCPFGTFGPVSGLPQCSGCAEGYYANNILGLQSCSPCPQGSDALSGSQATCDLCAPGTARGYTVEQREGCKPCGDGKYSYGRGGEVCDLCPVGTYSAQGVNPECTPCPPGQYSAAPGTPCVPCLAGTYSSLAGQTSCTDCATGFVAPETGRSYCSLCAAGSFAPNKAGNCSVAAPGSFSQAASATSSLCSAGSYSNATSQFLCTSCGLGEFTNQAGRTICSICGPGKYAGSTGSTICTDCPSGSFSSDSKAGFCTLCTPGKYQPTPGLTECTKCLAGSVTPNFGSVGCDECRIGQYQPSDEQPSCLLCPVGKYQPEGAKSDCIECAMGEYNDQIGARSCTACPGGSYTNVTAMTYCYLCSAGKQTNPEAPRFTECLSCIPGRYALNPGTSDCVACPAGRFGNEIGAIQCENCQAGYYANSIQMPECLPCAVGKYSLRGQRTCTLCEPGQYQTNTTSTSCDACAAGTFASGLSSIECENCGVGKYNPGTGQGGCLLCPPGQYQPNEGSSFCSSCMAGSFQSQLGNTSCEVCPAGSFTSGFGFGTCLLCGLGKYSPYPNSTECTSCPAGTSQQVQGSSECRDCVPGRFSVIGSTVCSPCPSGEVSPQPRATACVPCTGGNQPDASQRICVCSPGTYYPSLSDNARDCLSCPFGATCDDGGLTEYTISARVGYWRAPGTPSTTFYACLLPEHCVGGVNATCAAYRDGALCAVCMKGAALTQTGTCAPCAPSGATNYTTTVGLVLVIILVLWLMYYLLLRSDRSMVNSVKDKDEDDIDDLIRYDLYKKQCEFTLTTEAEMKAGYDKALADFTTKQNNDKIREEMKTRNTKMKLRRDNPDDLDDAEDDDNDLNNPNVQMLDELVGLNEKERAEAEAARKKPVISAAEKLGLDEDDDETKVAMTGEDGDADAVSALFLRNAMKLRRKRNVRPMGRPNLTYKLKILLSTCITPCLSVLSGRVFGLSVCRSVCLSVGRFVCL